MYHLYQLAYLFKYITKRFKIDISIKILRIKLKNTLISSKWSRTASGCVSIQLPVINILNYQISYI